MSDIGALGWAGIFAPVTLVLLLFRWPRLWPYVLVTLAPGIALVFAAAEAPTVAPTLDWLLSLLAMGTILAAPMAAMGWWLLHRPASRPGTLE